MQKQANKQAKAKRTKSDKIVRRSVPVSYGTKREQSRPKVSSTNGTVCVCHSEYIGDVVAPGASFSAAQYYINPGDSNVFPWLSTLANMYESYRFKKLKFSYEPSVATTTAGVIQLAVDYDVVDTAPTTKVELMANAHSVRCPPYESSEYVLDSKDSSTLGTRRFVLAGEYPPNTDPKTYDVGSFYVATSGFSAGGIMGELYVTYEVELFTPQYDVSKLAFISSGKVNSAGTVSKTAIFGTAPVTSGGLTLTVLSNLIAFRDPGEYLLQVYTIGTGLSGMSTAVTTAGGVGTMISSLSDAADTYMVTTYCFKINAQNASVTFNHAGATTVTSTVARISRYAYSLL